MTAPHLHRPEVKQPNSTPEFDKAAAEYLSQFPLTLTLNLGQSYGSTFKEFHQWCADNLGYQYKDWFLVSTKRGIFTLYLRNPKWLSILALRFSDLVDNTVI
jgi:hypothetical protein